MSQRSGFTGNALLSRVSTAFGGRSLTIGVSADVQRIVRENDRCLVVVGTDDECSPDFPSFRTAALLVGKGARADATERTVRLLAGPAVVWDERLGVAPAIHGHADATSATPTSRVALALWINATIVPRINSNRYTSISVGIGLRAQ